ncbi:MAG: hypothetical protein ACI4TA_03985 [Acetatifactor sp.]
MKKAVLLWVALLFLTIDTRIAGLIPYPEYIPFDTPAPETVDMIIGHLIGDSVHIDIFTDIIGYLLILYVSCKVVNENTKAFRAFGLSVLSLLLYLANLGMPFVLNGEARYTTGFFLYIAYTLLKTFTAVQCGFILCDMSECIENHAWINVVAIFIMLAFISGFIRSMSLFYNLPRLTVTYYTVQAFFTLLYSVMLWLRRSYFREGKS